MEEKRRKNERGEMVGYILKWNYKFTKKFK